MQNPQKCIINNTIRMIGTKYHYINLVILLVRADHINSPSVYVPNYFSQTRLKFLSIALNKVTNFDIRIGAVRSGRHVL